MEIKYLKSAVTLFFKLNPIAHTFALSKEILSILVVKEAEKLQDVKVGGLKKCLTSACPPAQA